MEKVIGWFLAGIFSGIAYVALLAYSVFSWGYTLYMLYGWFVEPVYAVPHITLNQAFGLILVISLFKNHTIPKKYKDHEEIEVGSNFFMYLLSPWLTLLSGLLVYSFI